MQNSTQRRVWMVSLALAVLSSGCRSAPPDRELESRETAAIAHDFMHLQYDLKDLKGAKAKYYPFDFTQHNPEIANGRMGDQKFIDAREKRDPGHFMPMDQWVNKIDHVLVDGKLFAIHHRLYTSPQDPGRVFMDIWRVENGRMVEHWDIIQAIPASAKNENTMWGDLTPTGPLSAHDPRPEAVIRDYLQVGLDQNDPHRAAEKYLAGDFRQHSPHIADGKAAALDYFQNRAAQPDAAARVSSVSHILSDGDLVLVTRHVITDAQERGFMYADLFRVRHGKITEHWDVIQPIPADSVNGNNMW